MSTVSAEQHQLHHLVARLRQSHPELHESEIRDIVAAALRELEGARLRQFVPLLVERSARAACREQRSNGGPDDTATRGRAADLVEGRVAGSEPDQAATADPVPACARDTARARRGLRGRVRRADRGSRVDARRGVPSIARARRASR